MTKHYDYILAGGGLAGLSLACHLVNSPLRDRSILIVDPDTKERNDRTWSYWTRQPGLFDGAVTHAWDSLRFVGNGVETIVPLGDYRYKTIRGDDFYRFARQLLAASPNVEFLHGRVERIDDGPEMATVVVDGKTLTCDWVFDSLPAQAEDSRYTHLKLYFRGWEIETPSPGFRHTGRYLPRLSHTHPGRRAVLLRPALCAQPGPGRIHAVYFGASDPR